LKECVKYILLFLSFCKDIDSVFKNFEAILQAVKKQSTPVIRRAIKKRLDGGKTVQYCEGCEHQTGQGQYCIRAHPHQLIGSNNAQKTKARFIRYAAIMMKRITIRTSGQPGSFAPVALAAYDRTKNKTSA
jgi:hypothetical protein